MTAEVTPEIKKYFQKRLKLLTDMLKIQIDIITNRVRFKVIVFLYFIPEERARSLSTLIAANVSKDTPLRHEPTTSLMLKTVKQS